MDIFILNSENIKNISEELLLKFQKKNFSNFEALKMHCFSYFMLDKILDEVYGIKNKKVVFNNKKPKLENSDKCFSISHSYEYAVIAFSDANCGVDIEKIKQRDIKKIASRMKFNGCDSLEDFYIKWTQYESRYKLSGEMPKSSKTFKYEEYIISAESANIQENFDIYVQIGEAFSKLKI